MKNLAWFKALQEQGIKVKGLDNIPTLLPEAVFFWEAFQTLGGKRIFTERGAQPIQVSEILAYTQYMDVTDDMTKQDLFYLINRLDAVYLTHVRETEQAAAEKAQKKAKLSARRR